MEFKRPSLSPLNHREFRLYVLVRFFYIMALQMVATVVAYELFHLTNDSFYIGLAGLSEFVPAFVLALYAGHVIDRSEKRTLLLRGVFCYMACVILFIALTFPSLQKGMDTMVLLMFFYTVIFFTGAIRSFVGPTFNAILSQLVPRNILHFAASISSTTWLLASISGHASAGFLIHWVGVNGSFVIILIYVIAASIALSKIGPKPIMNTQTQGRTWESMKEGLRFVFSNKILLAAISLDLFAVFFGGAKALIPEFAEKILSAGSIGFGWLNAAIDIGAAITLIVYTFSPLKKKQGLAMLFAIAGFGICMVIFGLSDFYAISFVALLVAGMLDGISVVIRGTVLQLTTPDNMRGRVSSVNSMFINSSNELGQFESGLASRLLGGARPAVIFGGIMTVIVVIVTWVKAPRLRKFQY